MKIMFFILMSPLVYIVVGTWMMLPFANDEEDKIPLQNARFIACVVLLAFWAFYFI